MESSAQRKATDDVTAQGTESASEKALPGPNRFLASDRLVAYASELELA